jgi:hypothetical protein
LIIASFLRGKGTIYEMDRSIEIEIKQEVSFFNGEVIVFELF